LRRLGYTRRMLLLFMYFLLAFTVSCGSEQRYAGTYLAEKNDSTIGVETYIDLKENGEGTWRVDDDEVSFSWYVKGNELRINTKEGGVIVGRLSGERIEVLLPGARMMSFKRTE